jgi:CMP-N,N'-diacetyllegionaminic acid synthase
VTAPLIALIPARAGSKRLPKKNTLLLNNHPLIAYAIATARETGIFGAIAVSSDDPDTLEIAERYGATHLILRPDEYAQDDSPDIQWVRHALEAVGGDFEAFAILRPTSPFRRGLWVRDAYAWFQESGCDSLRAMRAVCEHPGKMWVEGAGIAHPLLPFRADDAPWHSMPTQALPRILVQTAALEIAHTELVKRRDASIAGDKVAPWITGYRYPGTDMDLNTPDDWLRIEAAAARFPEWLPQVEEVRV